MDQGVDTTVELHQKYRMIIKMLDYSF